MLVLQRHVVCAQEDLRRAVMISEYAFCLVCGLLYAKNLPYLTMKRLQDNHTNPLSCIGSTPSRQSYLVDCRAVWKTFILSLCSSAELYVTAFQQMPSLRHALTDNVVATLLPNLLMSGRRLQRTYAVGPAGFSNIQIVSALVVQMLQVCSSNIQPYASPAREARGLWNH